MNSGLDVPSSHSFDKPIISGCDPWVIEKNGNLFYCYATPSKTIHETGLNYQNQIFVSRIHSPWSLDVNEPVCVWTAPVDTDYSNEVWAPELHLIGDKWYIYFTACGDNSDSHRIFVLESETDNPQGDYIFKGKMTDTSDKWAIDATVFQFNSGLYCTWSGWNDNQNLIQNIYIAKMSNPWTIQGERVLISTPEYDWEKQSLPFCPGGVNEGPQVLVGKKTISLIYSASGSWTDDYCLGQLNFVGADPLDPNSWKKHSNSVFYKTDKILGPGHASFLEYLGSNWIIYHAAKQTGSAWDRLLYAQEHHWDEHGVPVFGEPGKIINKISH